MLKKQTEQASFITKIQKFRLENAKTLTKFDWTFEFGDVQNDVNLTYHFENREKMKLLRLFRLARPLPIHNLTKLSEYSSSRVFLYFYWWFLRSLLLMGCLCESTDRLWVALPQSSLCRFRHRCTKTLKIRFWLFANTFFRIRIFSFFRNGARRSFFVVFVS